MSSTPVKMEKPEYSQLVLANAPSKRFGWHADQNSKTRQVLGWFTVLFLLVMLIGNQKGHIEDIYLVCIALSLAVGLILDLRHSRKKII